MKHIRIAVVLAALMISATAAFAKSGVLSLVPADAVSVGVIKLAELRTSPLSSTLFKQADKLGGNGEADQFLTDAGLDPARDIDVLVVATSPKTRLGTEGEVLVLANGRFNVDRLTKALVTRGAVKKSGYYTLPESEAKNDGHHGAVAFPDATLAIIGTEAAVTEALEARSNGGTAFSMSGLGRDAARIDANVSAWAVVDVTRAARLTGANDRLQTRKDQSGQALAAAIKSVSTVALWATDSGDAVKIGAFGLANDAETLVLLEDTIRGALSAMRLAVKEKSPDLVSVLRRFDVDRTSDSVRITGTIPGDAIRKLMAEKRASK